MSENVAALLSKRHSKSADIDNGSGSKKLSQGTSELTILNCSKKENSVKSEFFWTSFKYSSVRGI